MSEIDTPPAPAAIVITGASRGLGAGLASAFAARGIPLGLCARHEPSAPDPSTSVVAAVDVADAVALEAFADQVIARFGRIDLWINNAGILEPVGPLSQFDPEVIREHIETDVCGVLYGTAIFARHVRTRAGGGVLVNVSSGAATNPYQGWAAYCASKAAVAMASEVTALDEARFGLRVFALAPGVIDTDMQALVRATSTAVMPASDRFREVASRHAFNSPEWVASYILRHCWSGGPDASTGPAEAGPVRVRVPDEHDERASGDAAQNGDP